MQNNTLIKENKRNWTFMFRQSSESFRCKLLVLQQQTSGEKRKQKFREEFQLFYTQNAKLEIASRTDYDQDYSEMIQTKLKEIEIKPNQNLLQKIIKGLNLNFNYLKQQKFLNRISAYLDLIKQSQKYESEKLKPQLELMKSSLKIRAQKIYQQIS